ncbi:MAG: cytochrome c [Candidatus Melainabacteria bacterium]|jgi:cytochrome bd-type quinol oxidase subunit 1|nr:cytochrome c [Candidatus Melainabacteria bacterium]
MNYPIWVVPYLGGPWVIGIISIIHIFISHFAVGGGAFLAAAEILAYKRKNENLYDYLKTHSRFFLIVTTVSGAMTGVGIWFSISLVSPDGTASLIQIFTLAWALEYLFFVAELATAFAYYYTWDKISKEAHLKLAKLYFVFSVFTLVIINGIITFMLTPGKWTESHNWLDGFLNPTYWPGLIIRMLIMGAIAGMYALVTSSRIKDPHFRTYMVRFCAKWLLPIFILGPIVSYFYLKQIPQAAVDTIFTGIQTSGVGNFSVLARALYLSLILSGTIVLFAFFGPYLNPRGFTFRIAILFLICGLSVTGTTEWMRELLRKPFVVYNYMYSNGIRKAEIQEITDTGFLNKGRWAGALAKTPECKGDAGELMYRYQCMSCHTLDGYRSMKRMIGDRDKDAVVGFLKMLKEKEADKNPYHGIMPPLAASDEELDKLATYLASLKGESKDATKIGKLP